MRSRQIQNYPNLQMTWLWRKCQETHKELLKLVHEFNIKVCKKENNQLCFYILTIIKEIKYENKVSFVITQKTQVLGYFIIWQNMYRTCMLKSTKCWRKKLEKIKVNSETIPCSWTGRLIIVKMPILPKWIEMFHTIPIKMPARIFVDMHKIILKLIWEDRGTITAKTILKKKNKVKKKKRIKL